MTEDVFKRTCEVLVECQISKWSIALAQSPDMQVCSHWAILYIFDPSSDFHWDTFGTK